LIVRHGQSVNNAGIEARVSDPHLTEVGERQAELVAEALQPFGIDLLYVSPMRRTLQTAAPIAAATGLPARVFTGLHEWGGVYEEREGRHAHQPGLGRDEMTAIIPGLVLPEDVTESGWWAGGLDASRLEAVVEHSRANAIKFLDYLAINYPSDMTLAIVTHGGFGSNLMEAALHIDPHPEYFLRFEQNNTGHALIEITETGTRLRWHNRIDHLPRELVVG
jgi:2,3-bisphosphoglycerate-dependent phosphoglycerate mutase